MDSEYFPAEIAIPCSDPATVEKKRISTKPVPLVAAHSSISMRYDPSKPSRVAVVDPRSVASRRDTYRTRIDDSIPEHAIRRHADDVLSIEAKSPRRKVHATSRRRPLPLAPVQSSISMRLAPSRPGRVLVVNPASPSYYIDKNDAISPLSYTSGSIAPVEPSDQYLENEDGGDHREFTRRKIKTRSLRRPMKYQPSSASVQTAPSVIERVAISKSINPKGIKDAEREKVCVNDDCDEAYPKHSRAPSRSQSNIEPNNNEDDVVSDSFDVPQGDGALFLSPSSRTPHEEDATSADYADARDDESEADVNNEHVRQVTSGCDESFRGIRTIQSDFEVEVCTHEEIEDEQDEDALADEYSVSTSAAATQASVCSSFSRNGGKTKGLSLRRIVPTKIKNKLTQYQSGGRSVFSAPERKLAKIPEKIERNDRHETRRSRKTTIAAHPNVLEQVMSELTDANFSEDQSDASISGDYVAKKTSEEWKASTRIQRVEAEQTGKQKKTTLYRHADDRKSVNSGKSVSKYYRAIGQMLSPVTSDLSLTMSESFESRRVKRQSVVPESDSVAIQPSLFSKNRKMRSNLPTVCKAERSAKSLSRSTSSDQSTEKEDRITTIYDRTTQSRPSFLPREHDNVPEDSTDLKSAETAESSEITGYFSNRRPAKAQFGLSFEADAGNSFSGLDRHRSEHSRKAELAMLPSEDSGILEDAFPEPSPDYLKSRLDDFVSNSFIASLNSIRSQFGL